MNIRIVRTSGGGKNTMIAGGIIAAVFGLATIGCMLSEDRNDLFVFMIFCALAAMGGVSLIVKGFQIRHKDKQQPPETHEFDADAPDFVKDRLNEMMFEGVPGSTSVSKTVKRVTITRSDGTSHTTETVTENRSGSVPTYGKEVVITCESCGGINKLRRGQSGVCEYCGSHIEG